MIITDTIQMAMRVNLCPCMNCVWFCQCLLSLMIFTEKASTIPSINYQAQQSIVSIISETFITSHKSCRLSAWVISVHRLFVNIHTFQWQTDVWFCICSTKKHQIYCHALKLYHNFCISRMKLCILIGKTLRYSYKPVRWHLQIKAKISTVFFIVKCPYFKSLDLTEGNSVPLWVPRI